jgi:hypothetical protein
MKQILGECPRKNSRHDEADPRKKMYPIYKETHVGEIGHHRKIEK